MGVSTFQEEEEGVMYIDGGTGSMLLQAAAAMFFSCLVFFRQIKNWVVSCFKGSGDTDQ